MVMLIFLKFNGRMDLFDRLHVYLGAGFALDYVSVAAILGVRYRISPIRLRIPILIHPLLQ